MFKAYVPVYRFSGFPVYRINRPSVRRVESESGSGKLICQLKNPHGMLVITLLAIIWGIPRLT